MLKLFMFACQKKNIVRAILITIGISFKVSKFIFEQYLQKNQA